MPRTPEPLTLPDGITIEMLDEYARRKTNARRRADYARHPDRVERNRLTTYRNFLNRHGCLVISTPPAPPWDEVQQKCLLQALRCALEEQGGISNAASD